MLSIDDIVAIPTEPTVRLIMSVFTSIYHIRHLHKDIDGRNSRQITGCIGYIMDQGTYLFHDKSFFSSFPDIVNAYQVDF